MSNEQRRNDVDDVNNGPRLDEWREIGEAIGIGAYSAVDGRSLENPIAPSRAATTGQGFPSSQERPLEQMCQKRSEKDGRPSVGKKCCLVGTFIGEQHKSSIDDI